MRILHNTLAAILSVFTFLGCSQDLDTLPRKVYYDLFSLSGSGYAWKEVTYPHDNELLIINSFEELENYIAATRGNHQSLSVDFSTHTLLLVRGVEPYDTRATIEDLRQLPSQDYLLRIRLTSNIAPVITNWQVALVTPKLAHDDMVILSVVKDGDSPTIP